MIEQLPYGHFIRRYDHPGALFYLDPPYWDCEDDYGPGVFGRDDFAALAGQLAGIAGGFLLSINDQPEVRVIFDRFRMMATTTTYSISEGSNDKKAGELIITNLPADIVPFADNDD